MEDIEQTIAPCPVCGGRAKVRYFSKMHAVECTTLFCLNGPGSLFQDVAIEKWNALADAMQLKRAVEKLDAYIRAPNVVNVCLWPYGKETKVTTCIAERDYNTTGRTVRATLAAALIALAGEDTKQ